MRRARPQRASSTRNRLVREVGPDPDGAGAGLPYETTFVYDLAGNVLSRSVRLDATTDLVTSFTHDALDRELTVTDPNGDTVVRAYDDAGRLASLTDGELNTTTFLYDNLDRLIEEINALSASRLYVYDLAGNVVEVTDRNGRVREFEYDALDRLIEERWVNSFGQSVSTIRWQFDWNGRLWDVHHDDGRSSHYYFTYDELDRLLVWENDVGDPAVFLTATYDAVGNRTSLAAELHHRILYEPDQVFPDFVNTYSFDALNRTTRIEQSSQTGGSPVGDKRVDLAYNELGQFTEITRYEDLAGTEGVATSTYTRDNAHRLTALEHAQGTTTLAAYTWQFDAVERIIASTSADGAADLGYDALGQLLSADYTGGSLTDETFGWDSAGNPTGAQYTVGASNRLVSDGTYSYEYDGEGNRTRRTTIATGEYVDYTWDHRNRPWRLEFRSSDGTLTKRVGYSYDAFDRRIEKWVTDGTGTELIERSLFFYDGDNVVLVYDETIGPDWPSSLTHRFLPGPGVNQTLADELFSGDLSWLLDDHQGTVRDVADYDAALDQTTVANHVTYNAFGAIQSQSAPAVGVFHSYTGQIWDPDAELYYYRARWYDPVAGRFLSEDPSGFDGGDANLYRYVTNSPVNFTDPTGRRLWSPVADLGSSQRATGAEMLGLIPGQSRTVAQVPEGLYGFGDGSVREISGNADPSIFAPPQGVARGASHTPTAFHEMDFPRYSAPSGGLTEADRRDLAAIGATLLRVGGPILATALAPYTGGGSLALLALGAGGGFLGDAAAQGVELASGQRSRFSLANSAVNTGLGALPVARIGSTTLRIGANAARGGLENVIANDILARTDQGRVPTGGERLSNFLLGAGTGGALSLRGSGTPSAPAPATQTVQVVRSNQLHLGQFVRELTSERAGQMTVNRIRGRVFEDVAGPVYDPRFLDVESQVDIRPFSNAQGTLAPRSFRADRLGRDAQSLQTYPLEFKSSYRAPPTKPQRQGFPLFEQFGGVVEGSRGGRLFPEGQVLPPASIPIVRPRDLPREARIEFGQRLRDSLIDLQQRRGG